jgi:hypothetical protein
MICDDSAPEGMLTEALTPTDFRKFIEAETVQTIKNPGTEPGRTTAVSYDYLFLSPRVKMPVIALCST